MGKIAQRWKEEKTQTQVNRVFRLTMHSARKTKVIGTQITTLLRYAVESKRRQANCTMTEVRTRLCLNLRQKKTFLQAAQKKILNSAQCTELVTPGTSSVRKPWSIAGSQLCPCLRCVVPVQRAVQRTTQRCNLRRFVLAGKKNLGRRARRLKRLRPFQAKDACHDVIPNDWRRFKRLHPSWDLLNLT